MHIFFSAGEPSGDHHAAHLIEELRKRQPALRVSGFGGEQMEHAGCELLFPLTTMAVMGILRVLPLIHKFYKLVKQAEAFLDRERPDLVVLVDFPGFNWWIAKAAHQRKIPVVYFMPPQLWAWASWRIRKVKKYVDHVISGLPFEAKWYADRGVSVSYVGHPFFDEMATKPLDQAFCREWKSDVGQTVAILPGSRSQEISRNWPVQLDVISRLHELHPQATFLVANYKESQRRDCIAAYEKLGRELPIRFFLGKTSEILEIADCAFVVSGSVSLEVLARCTPAQVIYGCSWLTFRIARPLVKIDQMALPNLIAGRIVMPETLVIGKRDPYIPGLTATLDKWLSDPKERQRSRDELTALRDELFEVGAAARVAELLLRDWLPSAPRTLNRAA